MFQVDSTLQAVWTSQWHPSKDHHLSREHLRSNNLQNKLLGSSNSRRHMWIRHSHRTTNKWWRHSRWSRRVRCNHSTMDSSQILFYSRVRWIAEAIFSRTCRGHKASSRCRWWAPANQHQPKVRQPQAILCKLTEQTNSNNRLNNWWAKQLSLRMWRMHSRRRPILYRLSCITRARIKYRQ